MLYMLYIIVYTSHTINHIVCHLPLKSSRPNKVVVGLGGMIHGAGIPDPTKGQSLVSLDFLGIYDVNNYKVGPNHLLMESKLLQVALLHPSNPFIFTIYKGYNL